MTLVIGLTGGIASGKSTVANMCKEQGITVIDADMESRDVVEPGEKAYDQIIEHFGKGILLADGTINRAKLGEIIFNNKEERMVLNGIVHPAVRERMNAKKEAAAARNEAILIMDIPLLFESKLTNLVDRSLLVYVDETTQLKRLMERNQYSEQEAISRIQSQMPLKEKRILSDRVIDNSGTPEQTRVQLYRILKEWGFEEKKED
ncbi:dephospho-CoA kinase [Bacillus benzoevorans]|uniref:Dephospho-CoA kinase n=1 Tax=Bacillus benzoevorans TaxID=1456 RepID=A0A7X0LVJ2_9BACI|nr:dephospho-CoA kinase [Bacillus benzoevorans]MBB6445678.1 dephospho-CoA kinase [Bacillus benzoevorans]